MEAEERDQNTDDTTIASNHRAIIVCELEKQKPS